jgi:hypothetical protein
MIKQIFGCIGGYYEKNRGDYKARKVRADKNRT